MDTYFEANRRNWNDRVAIHYQDNGEVYDVEQFLSGRSTLNQLEIDGIGDVSGKTLLHLMCHFGLDTLSWARKGAKVTGVDMADQAIETARKLAAQAGLNATFVCSNVYDLPDHLTEQFDIVFASYGVLAWLPDMSAFLAIATQFLKPGGLFFLADIHPLTDILEGDVGSGKLFVQERYFHSQEPEKVDEQHSYTNTDRAIEHSTSYQWYHSLGDVINACIEHGIAIRSLTEYPYTVYNRYPGMMEKRGDRWVFTDASIDVPLLFAISGVKTEQPLGAGT